MDLQNLQQILEQQTEAPVHLWDPEYCGEMELQIKADGSWWYMGSEITRKRLVKLFSRVIKKEKQEYFLVTPVEKLKIKVEEFPFIANWLEVVTDQKQSHPWLTLKTNVGDQIKLDKDYPLIVENDENGAPVPIIRVRANLYAKLSRSVFYELVEMSESWDNKGTIHSRIYSGPNWFDLGSQQ